MTRNRPDSTLYHAQENIKNKKRQKYQKYEKKGKNIFSGISNVFF